MNKGANLKDYSQYGEQTAIHTALAGHPIGRFLDIGAWAPETFSNVRALYEIGWSGVCVEPSPGPMLGLLEAYGEEPRVTLIQAAMALESNRLIKLHVTDDAVTTESQAEYEKWKDAAKFRGSMIVPTVTLEQIANQFGGFQFISFDAEGLSAELFLKMLKIPWRPQCVCVEHDSRTTEILAAATAAGYKISLVNSTNVVMHL